MKKFLKKNLINILLFFILLGGLCLLLYPTVSNWWNSFHQSRAIASYVEAVENLSEKQKEEMLEAAHAYNKKLAKTGVHFVLSEAEHAEYESLLDITGTGIMGYVQIPSVDIYSPIYHGTDESVLQIAIGHLEGTSLPVGGESTHGTISGHRGLPSAKLFTDIDKLSEGDVFTITVLDETVTYEIDQIRIVLPEETSDLAIEDGKDYFTLSTCTPYGINTHRMLMRGHRIENAAGILSVAREASKVPTHIVVFAAGIPLLFLLLLITLIFYGTKKPMDKELADKLKK